MKLFSQLAANPWYVIFAVLACSVVAYLIIETSNSVSTGVAVKISELKEYQATPFARLPHDGPVQWRLETFPRSGLTSVGKIDIDKFQAWIAAENLSGGVSTQTEPYFQPGIDGKKQVFAETGDWLWEIRYFPNRRHFTLQVNETHKTFRISSSSAR